MNNNSLSITVIVGALAIALSLPCILHNSRITPSEPASVVVADANSPIVALRKVTCGEWQQLDEEKDFFYSFRQKQINDKMGKFPTFVKREGDGAVIEYTEIVDLGEKPAGKWLEFRYIGTGKSYCVGY